MTNPTPSPLAPCHLCKQPKTAHPTHGCWTYQFPPSAALPAPTGAPDLKREIEALEYVLKEHGHKVFIEFNPSTMERYLNRMRQLAALSSLPPQPAAPAVEEPPFAWPDPKYTAYSFEGPRGITCAVSEEGDIFIRPNATKEELHAALLGVLSDDGVPLPEPTAPAPGVDTCRWWWDDDGQDFLTSCRESSSAQRKVCGHCKKPVRAVKTFDALASTPGTPQPNGGV